METLEFVDLFAGLGGFHAALSAQGHACVFASEIDSELQQIYAKNFTDTPRKAIVGDIRKHWQEAPRHDVLCAGFPCQPFSKSGSQLGTADSTRGTLFHEIIRVLERRRPDYVILENVGNFARHDKGRTWAVVRASLERLDYTVQGTEHVTPHAQYDWRDRGGIPDGGRTRGKEPARIGTPGIGLLSPHHFGEPHHRERFFVVAAQNGLPERAFPERESPKTTIGKVIQSELTEADVGETALSRQQRKCIQHWNALLRALPDDLDPPTFPLWGDELGAKYPYERRTPWATPPGKLRLTIPGSYPPYTRKSVLLDALPSYAREEVKEFRRWKVHFIRENRAWWTKARRHLPSGWARELQNFPPSLRKLEWNVKDAPRDLWRHVLQFRPSGLRVRRYDASPALVAMTSTQIPILGPQKRFLTRTEGLRLLGLRDSHVLPESRSNAFRALGNGVHVKVAQKIAQNLIAGNRQRVNPIAA